MIHKFLPKIYGVVKDYHARMIPEDKASDCLNVMFKQGRFRRRYGYEAVGPTALNGIVNGIAYYEQVRLGYKFTVVFTSRDAFLYDTTTGGFTPITPEYHTGTAYCDATAVTGSGTTWDSVTWVKDVYQIKFGTNAPATEEIGFTGDSGSWGTVATAESNTWESVASNGEGTLLACSSDGTNRGQKSTDNGATWASFDFGEANPWFDIAYGNGAWIAIAQTGTHQIARSTNDGTTWTLITAPYFVSGVPGVVVYDEDSDIWLIFEHGASSSSVLFSLDGGATWDRHQSADVCGNGVSSGGYVTTTSGYHAPTANIYINDAVDYTLVSPPAHGCYFPEMGAYYNTIRPLACGASGDGRVMVFGVPTAPSTVGVFLSHDDGQTYTEFFDVSSTFSFTFSASYIPNLIYGGGLWFLSIYDEDASACKIYSSNDDGETWELIHTIAAASAAYPIVYDHGQINVIEPTLVHRLNTWTIESVSALTGLYRGLELSGDHIQDGSRITGINFGTSVITLDRPVMGAFTGDSITADISTWYEVYSVDSGTGITLDAVQSTTGNITNTSAVITNIPDTSILHAGMGIDGHDIPANSYILSIDSATQITISAAATGTHTANALTFGVYIESAHTVNYVLKLCFSGDTDDFWSFAYPYSSTVTDKMLVATNGIDTMVKWDGSGSMEYITASGFPETAKYIGYFGAAMYEHFVAAWTTDSGSNLPQTVEISDAGDAETWTAGCYYDLLQKNDEIVWIEILKTALVVYKKLSISLIQPTPEGGNDDPMDVTQDVIVDVEIMSGRTVCNMGDFHIFLAKDNVYKFNGISLEPIGSEVINTMKNEWRGEYMHRAFAINIPNENLYVLFIPTVDVYENDVLVKAATDYPNKAYLYNYQEGTWTIWQFANQFVCAGYTDKIYAPTVADIDALNRTWSDMRMRWSDLIVYSNINSLLIGDSAGYVHELRDIYTDDNGNAISANLVTRCFPLNDEKHTVMLLEAVLGMSRKLTGNIHIRASVDFGANWSAWVLVTQAGGAEYVEYVANFLRKGRQAMFEIANVDGADFEVESIIIGFNEQQGKEKCSNTV